MFYEENCTLCGECLIKCPYLAYPEEKAKAEFKKLIEGKASPVTSECITCAACNMICPEDANPFDLINERQEETGDFKITGESMRMFEMASKMPSKIIKGDPDKPVMSLCTLGDILPGVIEGQLFDGLTLLKGGKYFCYFGWIHAAKPSIVKEYAELFVNTLTETGAKEIICFHDDCYAMLTSKIKEYNINLNFKPIHIFEYLRDYVKNHLDQVKKLNMKIAYQQPCASRYTFDKDEILDELFELIGVERVARKYDRETALCCGGVQATMLNISKEESDEWKMRNLIDAKENGAEAMVFLCPICVLNLRTRAKTAGLEPYFISNLVRLALGEELTYGGAGKIYK
jgi:Fe-S oxidoreductase